MVWSVRWSLHCFELLASPWFSFANSDRNGNPICSDVSQIQLDSSVMTWLTVWLLLPAASALSCHLLADHPVSLHIVDRHWWKLCPPVFYLWSSFASHTRVFRMCFPYWSIWAHRPSIKGTKLFFIVIKAIIIIWNAVVPGRDVFLAGKHSRSVSVRGIQTGKLQPFFIWREKPVLPDLLINLTIPVPASYPVFLY